MPAISFLIVDANTTFSKAAQFFLARRSAVKTVEIASNLRCALDAAGRLKPDIILIDANMVTENQPGRNFCEQLQGRAPGAVILILTLFGDSMKYSRFPEIERISGFVSKERFADTLIPLIRSCSRKGPKKLRRSYKGGQAMPYT